MKRSLFFVGMLLLGTVSAAVAQQQVAVIAPGGIVAALKALIPGFESKSGYQVKLTSSSGAGTKKQVAQGDAFDVALLQPPFPEVIASGNMVVKSQKPVANAVMGIAVKKGAPKPDISTPEAVKKLLLSVKSFTYPDAAGGAGAGVSFDATLRQMGIADQVKAKIILAKGGADAMAITAKGGAEIGLTYISEIEDPGVDIVGPLPAAISPPTQLIGVVLTHVTDAKGAQAFLDYITSPAAGATYVSLGMRPAK